MVRNADGSVIIDTGLDSSGVDIGAKEVEKRINAFISSIDKFGARLQKATAGYATNAGEILSREYTKGFEGAAAKLRDMAAAQIPTDGYRQVTTEIEKAEAALDKLQQKQEKLKAMGADQTSHAWQKVQQDIDDTTAKLEEQRAKVQEVKDTLKWALSEEHRQEVHAEGPEVWGQYVEEMEALKQVATEGEAEIQKMENSLAKLTAKQEQMKASGADLGSKQWRSLQYDIEQVTEKIAQLRAEKEKMESDGSAFMNGSDTEEYQRLKQELEELEAMLNREATPAQKLSGVMVLLGSAIKSVADHALSLGKRLAKVGFNAVTSSAKKAISTLKAYTAQTRKTDLANNALVKSLTSIKRLLITRIKRMFISSIFNSVREGLQQLAQFDAAFNVHMSNIKNSAKLLSNNIAILLSNIISVVEPVITKILELLSRVVDAINQVFAVLQGKSTYTSAAKGAESYAESAADAAKAQKKWNNELYSFDELNRQSKNNDSSTAGAAQTLFGEQQINLPAAVSDWIERLKAAWKAGDWYGIGKVIAEGINKAMEIVDNWINTKFRPIAVEWASRIAKIFNGLIDGLDWPLIGKTLADGLNAVFDAANTFLTTTNWLTLGRRISDAVKSWFDNVEWDLVGKTFANKWNALIRTIRGFVTNAEMWASIGTSIGRFVKSWFSTIDINSIAGILIGVLNGVTTAINAFLSQNPFEGVAEKISSAVNRVVHEVNWVELGKSISDLFMEALNTLHDVVSQIDWHGIGVAIGEFLGSIDWTGVFTSLAEIIWTAFKGVIEGLFSTSGGRVFLALLAAVKGLGAAFTLGKMALLPKILGFNTLGSKLISSIGLGITGAIAGFGVYFAALQDALTNGLNWLNGIMIPVGSSLAGAGVGAIIGSLGGPIGTGIGALVGLAVGLVTDGIVLIKEHWTEITAWIIEKWNAFSGWISGAWNNLATFAGNVWNTISTAITTAFDAAVSWVKQAATDVGNWISTTWTNITTWTSTAWNNVTTAISTAFTNAKTAVVNTANQIGTQITTTWNNVKSWTSTAWNNVKTTVTTTFNNAKSAVVSTANTLKSNLSSAWNSIKSTASSAWNSIKSTATSAWTSLSQTVSSKWQALKDSLGRLDFTSIGKNLVEGLKNGVGGAWDSLVSKVKGLAQGLISKVKGWFGVASPSKVFAEIGEYLDAGMEQGIADGEGKLLHTAGNVAEAVTNGMTPDSPKVSMTAEGVVGSMQAVISGLSSIAATFQTIANTLTAMGGLQVPQIAAGTVVPYKTKVDSNAPAEDESDPVEGYLSGIDRALQTLIELIRANGQNNSDIKVLIDGREVFNVVVNENNRAIRRTGTSPIRV